MTRFLHRLAVLALTSLLLLTACRSSSCEGPQRPSPAPEASSQPAKVVLRLSFGHLHGKKNFHFVPSGGTFQYQDLFNTQEFTFLRQGDQWVLAPESLQTFIAFQTNRYNPSDPGDDAPDYGARLFLYDEAGRLINDDYASEGKREHYQFFAYPSAVSAFAGSSVSYDASRVRDFMDYVYCDTNVWDQGASKSPTGPDGRKLYYFLPDTEPVGFKGYYQFLQQGRFTLHIDLWHTPAGKLEGGVASPFYQPNATVRSGRPILQLQLPVAVFADTDFRDEVIGYLQDDLEARANAAATPEERRALQYIFPTIDAIDEELQTPARRLMELLKTNDWPGIQKDFLEYFLHGGDETSSEGYF